MSPGKTSILLTLTLVLGVGGYVYWSNQTTTSAPLEPSSEPVMIEEPPLVVVATTAPQEHPPFLQSELEPFLEANCIACHGPDKQKGKVRFDSASWSLDGRDSIEFWSEVLTVLEDGEMPPEEEPRPDAAQLAAFVSSLKAELEDTSQLLADQSDSFQQDLDSLVEGTPLSQEIIQPFLEQHCIQCHGSEKQKGQLRFDQVHWEITTNDAAQRWQDVLDVLNGGEMPPEDEPRPSNEELIDVLDSLTRSLVDARKRLTANGGEITMRRLNQREYANTIRDLFGFEISPHIIPPDAEADSFDTVGEEQFFSANDFDKYFELGKKIAEQGFKWSGRPLAKTAIQRIEPEKFTNQKLRKLVADFERKKQMLDAGKTWQEIGFQDAGDMNIFFRQRDANYDKPVKYLKYPLVDHALYFADIRNSTRINVNFGRNPDIRASYRIRINGGAVEGAPEVRKYLKVDSADGVVGIFKLDGTDRQPDEVELLNRLRFGDNSHNLTIYENRPEINGGVSKYIKLVDKPGAWAAVWVDWLETEGPFYRQQTNFFGELINAKDGASRYSSSLNSDDNAREFIERFAYQAFRHKQPEPAYIDSLLALFEENRANGQNFNQAMGEAIAVVLASPSFLYLEEVGSGPKDRQLSDREFAVRLAYFLWSSLPDEELYRFAENGALSDPKVLKGQVNRMLTDWKSEAFYEGFSSQWGDLDRYQAITVDENQYYLFNSGVRYSAYREVVEFYKTLVSEDLPITNLIDSEFIVANSLLADYYGMPITRSEDPNAFQKIALDWNSPRGGLLGQSAFLTMGSNGERTSPVIRGAMILEKLLNDKPAPPPPNVPELSSASKQPLTNREMVQRHQSQAACASCHSRMDPLGFGLEIFDTVGRWRDTEPVGNDDIHIQESGKLVSGMIYRDLDHLKALLKTQKHKLAKEMIESMTAYGLGRTMEFSDDEAILAMVNRSQYTNYRMRDMIHIITSNPLFKSK